MGLLERLKSEYAYLSGSLRTLAKIKKITGNPGRTYPDVASGLADTYGDRVALMSERERLTYRQYEERANQYARWAKAHGVGKGDVVGLMMPNRPEYLAVWLGIARAGGVTALLNTNLTGQALAHCVNIVRPKHVIVDAELLAAFEASRAALDPKPTLWCYGGVAEGYERLDSRLDTFAKTPIPAPERPTLTIEDKCLFIYTSGTTGLPKAANINHYRVQAIMFGFSAAMRITPEDRMYMCLPMYHTSGGVLAVGAALTAGASVVIRRKYSSTMFWPDIVQEQCTVFQYIGELCRYLLNSPPHPQETKHKIRLVCGNGLRPDIWKEFQERFKIPEILEWYAATEGNCVFLNFDGKIGAVGRIPKWAKRRFVTEIIRLEIDSEQPLRGPDGFCIKCGPGEVGEAVSQILMDDPSRPNQRFEGYADAAATEKKILRDVFEKGDRWFRSGDLMRKDAMDYFYFVDRIGDTFRWKGENVATSEVSESITAFPGVMEANVYGVHVSGMEGRAGMAALVVEDGIDLEGFRRHVSENLPAYARPVFLRIKSEIDTTSTFKQRKLELVKEGFDPLGTSDPIYFLHPDRQAYVRLDAAMRDEINEGRVRL